MTDLKLTADGDLDCSEHGLHLVDSALRVAQQVRTSLRTFLGEWEFDLDAGVPWFQQILALKGVNLNDVDSIIKTQIRDVEDVLDIIAFSMAFDSAARSLTITAKITTTFGVAVVEGIFP